VLKLLDILLRNKIKMEKIQKTTNFNNDFNKSVISWEAPDYVAHQKGWQWFFIAGVFVVIFSVYAVITDNWTLLIALLVLSALYVWQHFQTPKTVSIIISKAGIKVGNKEFPYQSIRAFWVIYRPPYVKTLNLRFNAKLMSDISIHLEDQNPGDLREYLCSQIREIEGKEESFTDSLIRIFKL